MTFQVKMQAVLLKIPFFFRCFLHILAAANQLSGGLPNEKDFWNVNIYVMLFIQSEVTDPQIDP